jgi:carbon monoxide dehydrogenase subunit G
VEVKSRFTIDASITDVWRVLTTSSTVALSPIGAILADHEGYRFATTVTLEISPVEVHYRGRGTYQPRSSKRRELVLETGTADSSGVVYAIAKLSGSLTAVTPHRTGVTIATRLKIADDPLPLVETIAHHAAGRLVEELQACMTHGLGPEPSTDDTTSPTVETDTAPSDTTASESAPNTATLLPFTGSLGALRSTLITRADLRHIGVSRAGSALALALASVALLARRTRRALNRHVQQ